jgi:hypothetical protein
MRRLVIALSAVAAVLVPAATASATSYQAGSNFMQFATPFGGDVRCAAARLDVTGSTAQPAFANCIWTAIQASFVCTTATYSATTLSGINCAAHFNIPGTLCTTPFYLTGSVSLTGAITVLNAGQSLTATIPNNMWCNPLFRLTTSDPHTFAVSWGSVSGGTGDIVFV